MSHSLKTLIQCCLKEKTNWTERSSTWDKNIDSTKHVELYVFIFTNRFKMDKHSQDTNERRLMSLFQKKLKSENIFVQ